MKEFPLKCESIHTITKYQHIPHIVHPCICFHTKRLMLNKCNFFFRTRLSCQGQKPEGRSWHTMTRLDRQNLILMGGYNDRDQILGEWTGRKKAFVIYCIVLTFLKALSIVLYHFHVRFINLNSISVNFEQNFFYQAVYLQHCDSFQEQTDDVRDKQ